MGLEISLRSVHTSDALPPPPDRRADGSEVLRSAASQRLAGSSVVMLMLRCVAYLYHTGVYEQKHSSGEESP